MHGSRKVTSSKHSLESIVADEPFLEPDPVFGTLDVEFPALDLLCRAFCAQMRPSLSPSAHLDPLCSACVARNYPHLGIDVRQSNPEQLFITLLGLQTAGMQVSVLGDDRVPDPDPVHTIDASSCKIVRTVIFLSPIVATTNVVDAFERAFCAALEAEQGLWSCNLHVH